MIHMNKYMKRLLCAVILCVMTITTVAAEPVLQGCRRGKVPQSAVLRRAAADQSAKRKAIFRGQRRQLVVLAQLPDIPFKQRQDSLLTTWKDIFNNSEALDSTFTGSVHDYFYSQSDGLFSVSFDLQYVELSQPASHYASTQKDDEASQFLVKEVMDSLLLRDIDWSQYDWYHDGEVSQLLIVYSGKGSKYGGFGPDITIWPHQWWLSFHENLETADDADRCEPVSFTYQAKSYFVDRYCAVQEIDYQNFYGNMGTLCHEYSHCLGFPDFYASGAVVGKWDLMDNGYVGNKPVGYSAHERMFMGWNEPVELKMDTVITQMKVLSDSYEAYLIRNDGHADEYYIVENRRRKGWDSVLPGDGVVIFHVDFDEETWTAPNTVVNTQYGMRRYDVFRANNKSYFPSEWAYPYTNNDMLTNVSTPAATLNNANSDSTFFMNKPITGIHVDDNGLASFQLEVPTPVVSGVEKRVLQTSSTVLYQYGPVSIVRRADGTVVKVFSERGNNRFSAVAPVVRY